MDLQAKLKDLRQMLEPWQGSESEANVFIEEHGGAQFGIELIDNFIERHGYKDSNPRGWFEYSRASSIQYLRQTLEHMYYPHPPECIDIARKFVEIFSDRARFVSAGTLFQVEEYPVGDDLKTIEVRCPFPRPRTSRTHISGYNPLTSWSFDAGIVAVDEKLIGMVWVAGEDH